MQKCKKPFVETFSTLKQATDIKFSLIFDNNIHRNINNNWTIIYIYDPNQLSRQQHLLWKTSKHPQHNTDDDYL